MSGWAVAVSVAVSVAATAYSSVAQSEAADEAAAQQRKYAELQNQQADQEVAASQSEAEIIRDKARRTQAAQAAALAASGVKLDGEGTGSALMGETTALAEKDALLALRTGSDKASLLRGQAGISNMKADSLEGQATSYLVGGALSSASQIAGGVAKVSAAQESQAKADKINSQGWATRNSSSYSLLGGTKLKTS